MERQAVTVWPVAKPHDEVSLVSAARDGDRAAFGRLYDRPGRMVRGFLLAHAPRRKGDALARDFFLLAQQQPHAPRDFSRFAPWRAPIRGTGANDFSRKWFPGEVPQPRSE